MNYTMNKQNGVTIIELMIVILMLGLLAAFEMPRFVDLASSDRESTVKELEGSLRSAATMAHARQLAQNEASNEEITSVDGTKIGMKNRYPVASDISALLQSLDGFEPPSVEGDTVTFTKTGANDTSECWVSYKEAGSLGESPVFSLDVSGC